MDPHIEFCTSGDGDRLAYQTFGERTLPALLYVAPWHGSLEEREEVSRQFWRALSEVRFGIAFDRRGTGASERNVTSVGVDSQCRDISALLDHVGVDRVDILAQADGIPTALAFSAHYSARVRRVVCFEVGASIRDPGLDRTIEILGELVRANPLVGIRAWIDVVWPEATGDERRTIQRRIRRHASPDVIAGYFAALSWDGADHGERVKAPTLVIQPTPSAPIFLRSARELTARIRGARFTTIDPREGRTVPEQVLELTVGFVCEDEHKPEKRAETLPAGTAIILFTDIADSTALTERMGDAPYRALSRSVDERVRAAMRERGGKPVEGKVLGDGVMGVFTSASQAIAAARACVDIGRELPMHIGLHAGDVTSEDDAHGVGNVYGGAVNIAARIQALAAPGEILVSATVRDLARTSAGVVFEDRGEHALKGIAEPQRVFAVRPSPA